MDTVGAVRDYFCVNTKPKYYTEKRKNIQTYFIFLTLSVEFNKRGVVNSDSTSRDLGLQKMRSLLKMYSDVFSFFRLLNRPNITKPYKDKWPP